MEHDEYESQLEQLYSSAQSASSEGLAEEAIRRCEEALILIETHGEESDTHSYADFVMLMGDVHWAAGEYEDAWRCYHRVVLNEPERSDARVAMGVALYHLCRFTSSRVVLEMCSVEVPDDAETWYYLGLLTLRDGHRNTAYGFLEAANELEEGRFRMPVELSDDDIRRAVARLIASLPAPFAENLAKLPITIKDHPDEELLFSSDPPLDPTVPLVLDGIPHGEDATDPEHAHVEAIIAFRENLWLLGYDPEVLHDELFATVRQEIAHFFGLSDEELEERGMD